MPSEFDQYVTYFAHRYNIPEGIFRQLIAQESGGNPNAVSPAGAVGVAQFMPGTWTSNWRAHPELGQQYGDLSDPSNRTNWKASIAASAAHLSDLKAQAGGDIGGMLVGYNAGPGYIGPYLNSGLGAIPMETRTYLNAIMGSNLGPGELGPANPLGGYDDYYVPGTDPFILSDIEKDYQKYLQELQLSPEGLQLIQLAIAKEVEINRARQAGQTDMELRLLRERAEIDKQLQKLGFEQSLYRDAIQFGYEVELQKMQFANQKEIVGIQEEGALRRQVLGELGLERRSQRDEQTQARGQYAATQGDDPFRAAALLQGMTPTEKTPTGVFREQLRQVAEAPLLSYDPMASTSELLATQQTLQNRPTVPNAPGVFGAAGGAAIQIRPDNPDPDVHGETGVGILVGERGPEVMEVKDDGVRIIPLVSKGAGGIAVKYNRQPLGMAGGGTASYGSLTQPAGLTAQSPQPPNPMQPSNPNLVGRVYPRADAPGMPSPISAPSPVRTPGPLAAITAAPLTQEAATPQASTAAPPAAPQLASFPQTPVEPQAAQAVIQALPDYAGPGADQFMTDLLARWPNVSSIDAHNALTVNLPTVSNMILQFVAGLVPESEAYDFIKSLAPVPGDQAPPGIVPGPGNPGPIVPGQDLTPAQQIEWVNDLLQRWPDEITGQDVYVAWGLGLQSVGDALNEVLGGTMTAQEAYEIIRGVFPGWRNPSAEPPQFDVNAMRNALQTLWSHVSGEGNQPLIAQAGALGSLQPNLPFGEPGSFPANVNFAENLGNYGVRQRAFRNSETGQVFILASDGMLHAITSPGLASQSELNFLNNTPGPNGQTNTLVSPSSILELSPGALQSMAPFGEDWLAGQGNNAFRINQELGRRPEGSQAEDIVPLASPLVEPVTGLVLPRPDTVARVLGQLNPAIRDLVIAAYESAGIPFAALDRMRRIVTPTGTHGAGLTASLG